MNASQKCPPTRRGACAQGIFNDDAFAKMKRGARLVNVARGGVVDDAALVRALDAGIVAQVGGASTGPPHTAACWAAPRAAAHAAGVVQPAPCSPRQAVLWAPSNRTATERLLGMLR